MSASSRRTANSPGPARSGSTSSTSRGGEPLIHRQMEEHSMPQGPTRVLITGGSRGLGRAIAQHLAERGAAVGLIARDPDDLQAAAAAIQEAGGRAFALACDVRERGALEGVVSRIAETLGGLDALVLAAGQLRGIG